jgi:hypothetical protein
MLEQGLKLFHWLLFKSFSGQHFGKYYIVYTVHVCIDTHFVVSVGVDIYWSLSI